MPRHFAYLVLTVDAYTLSVAFMLFSLSLHQSILIGFALISLLGNCILIILILHRESVVLGNYRWLLLSFCIGDIIISLFHAYAVPSYFQIEFGCVAYTEVSISKPRQIGFLLNTTFCLLFYEPFILLMFHFVYRYLLLFKINSGDNFDGIDLFGEIGVDFTDRLGPSLVFLNYLNRSGGINWMTVGCISNSAVIAGFTLSVNAYYSIRILIWFRNVSHNMSKRTRQLQIHLFQALLVQVCAVQCSSSFSFFVPFILCFVPFSTIIVMPLTGRNFGNAGTIIFNVVSTFPAVDAFIAMFVVGRYHYRAPLCVMYFVNYLNRNKTDPYYPAFEIIYGIEFAFIVAAFVAGVIVIELTYETKKLHRLIRLRIISSIVNDLVFIVSRLFVMHHEYFGPSEYVETVPLIFGSIMKQIFLGYMTALLSVLALDRWVATKAWAWYESSANSTLLFFLLQEAILFLLPATIGYLLVHEYITSMHAIYCFAVLVLIGSPLLALVYRLNVKVTRELKRGAVIHRYSISRTYQIRENVWMLSAFKRIARPLVIVCIPPFIFSPIYQRVPPNIGYDGLRFFSASMYDLWLSLASFVVILSVPYFIHPLRRSRRTSNARVIPVQAIAKIEKNIPETGDAYFAMLSNDLMKGPPR